MKITTRKHKVLAKRERQLTLNFLAGAGGRDYIDERLWRAPNESEMSWSGVNIVSGRSVVSSVGRRERTALINDASRIASKIQQYLFKESAERAGIDADWEKDVDGSGTSINAFWQEVSEALTLGQWVWVSVSRLPNPVDENGLPRERTLAEKREDRDSPRWRLWPSVSVPDWSFGEDGKLRWILTEETLYDNANPFAEARDKVVRTLWRLNGGRVDVARYDVGSAEPTPYQTATLDVDEIPFMLVGKPSHTPWWFDEVENNQAQLLNLESLHFESMVKTIFPQLIIPLSMSDNLKDQIVEMEGASLGGRHIQIFRELTRSIDGAMVEAGEDRGVTRYLMPPQSEMQIIPEERDKKRQAMFDMVGMSLFNKESRLMQTAESKQFDMLDTESTLKSRALVLQDAEAKLVELSARSDAEFKRYQPVWPTSFDVVDVEADANALTTIQNIEDITPSMRKIALLTTLRLLRNMGGATPDLLEKAAQEIAELDLTETERMPLDDGDGGDGEGAGED